MKTAVALALVMAIGAVGVSARAAAPTDLSTPFQYLVPVEERERLEHVLARSCPDAHISLQSSIREFVSVEFFERCIQLLRGTSRQLRQGFYPVGTVEQQLRSILSKQWLTLNMSDEDIAAHEQDPFLYIFTPLELIDLTPLGYGMVHAHRRLQVYGIYVVRDFLEAYRIEIELPRRDRWRLLDHMGPKTIGRVKAGLDELAKGRALPASALSTEVRDFLKLHHGSAEEDVRAACDLLLRRFGEN